MSRLAHPVKLENDIVECLFISLYEAILDLPTAMKFGDMNAFIAVGNRLLSLEKKIYDYSYTQYILPDRNEAWVGLLQGVPMKPYDQVWGWFNTRWIMENWKDAKKLVDWLGSLTVRMFNSPSSVFNFEFVRSALDIPTMKVVYAAIKVADTSNLGYDIHMTRVWNEPNGKYKKEGFFL